MIYDMIENSGLYLPVHSSFKRAFKFLCGKDLQDIDLGKHELDSKGTYAIVQEYDTKEHSDGFVECHRKYIDIQFLASGVELVGVCQKSACTELSPYDEEKDFQKLDGKTELLTLRPGLFMVFFPPDGHMPCLKHGKSSAKVRKIVVKVPVQQ